MNKEKLNKLQEVINDQLDLIEMNVARINNKDYFGLDFELVKYIRNLENQLDIANNKLKEVKEELIDTRKECFNQMAEKYEEDGESNEAHFLNFQVLPSIDKSLSIIGSD